MQNSCPVRLAVATEPPTRSPGTIGHVTARNGEHGYGWVTKTLHWLTVAALIAQFVVGYLMDDEGGQGRGRGRGGAATARGRVVGVGAAAVRKT